MAQNLNYADADDVTLAATCNLLTFVGGAASTLVIWSSTVDVYLVTVPGTADGAALPSTRYRDLGTVTAGSPIEVDITPYGTVLLAGSGSGTARVEVR